MKRKNKINWFLYFRVILTFIFITIALHSMSNSTIQFGAITVVCTLAMFAMIPFVLEVQQ